MYKAFSIVLLAFISLRAFSQEVKSPHVQNAIKFTENNGQWDEHILCRAGLDGGVLFLEKDKLTYNFYDKVKARKYHTSKSAPVSLHDREILAHAFTVSFLNANNNVTIDKLNKNSDYENFFIGNDKSKWKGNVYNYKKVVYQNLYNHVDYEILSTANFIKYNFIVKPGGFPDQIKLQYKGVDDIKLKDGALNIKFAFNELFEQKPYAYQLINGDTTHVPCRFVLKDKILSYQFPSGYNKNYTLIIDPLLIFAAQSGSTADNFGMTATFDAFGNLYSGGTVFDIGYPTTVGAYKTTFFGPPASGNTDVVITKYSSVGSSLLFSTYIGGSFTETVHSLIVDKNDNLCFYGVTSSSNFPTLAASYDKTFNGGFLLDFVRNGSRFLNGTDIYIGKLNTAGTSLLASTYIGGSDNDGVNRSNKIDGLGEPAYDSLQNNYGDQFRGEIQVDLLNNIYIASSTRSSNFPTVNTFDGTLGGKQDGVVCKFDPNLTSLLYSSYIGGSSNDASHGLVVKSDNEVYVTGGTCSNDFPYAGAGYQTAYQGGSADGYIIRINAAGNTVLNGTYFGTPQYDQSYFIQADKYNDIYIYGQSLGNMPILKAAASASIFNVPNTHQFISRLNKTLNTLNMSTVFGHYTTNTDISPSAFAVDKCNNIYVSGWGTSLFDGGLSLSAMPLMAPTQATTDGHDFYFMGLDSNAAVLKYGSYFGGGLSQEHVDGGTSRFDPQGIIYQSVCAGCGGNDDFPVTPGSWPLTPGNPNHSSNCNNGVIKIDFQLDLAVSTINTNTLSGCSPLVVKFKNATPGASFIWYLPGGVTNTVTPDPTVTFTTPGTYTVSLVVKDPLACNIKDSAISIITVFPSPNAAFTLTLTPCTNLLSTTNTSSGSLIASPYLWDLGDGSPTSTVTAPSYTYPANGTYTVSLTVTSVNGCTSTATQTINVFNFLPNVALGDSICFGASTTLTASGGTSYTWSPGATLSSINTATTIANPTVTTIYTVTIENNSGGFPCTKTLTTSVTVFPKLTSAFTFSIGFCNNDVQFTDGSFAGATSWQWKFGDGGTSGAQNPLYYYSTPGSYTVTLITKNQYGCADSVSQVVTVSNFVPIGVNKAISKCEPDTVQLNAVGGVLYIWKPSASLSNSYIPNPKAFPRTTTIYTVTICTLKGLDTCKSQLTTTVNIYPFSPSSFTISISSTTLTAGQSATLTIDGLPPGNSISVFPATHIVAINPVTYVITPTKSGEYIVFVKDENGCSHELKRIYIKVEADICNESVVYLPTGFSPNGDGANDILYIRSNFITEVFLTIYDRWGEKLFTTSDVNIGWDGTYKGKPLDQGVYGYYMTFKCNNGQESFKKGNITLFR